VVVRLTAYLFVWMGRRRARLVLIACLVSCLRIAGATSVYQLESEIRLWLGVSLYDLWISLCCGDFSHMSGFEYFIYGCIYELMTWLFEVYVIFRCEVCWNFYTCWFGEFKEDVTSISWIIIIFACFIALIEVKRYNMHLTMKWPHQPT